MDKRKTSGSFKQMDAGKLNGIASYPQKKEQLHLYQSSILANL